MAYGAKTKWIKCAGAVVVVKDVTNNITTVMPTIEAAYTASKGNKATKILDGAAAVSNVAAGTGIGRIRLTLGMIAGVTNAAWFNNAYTLNEADNTANYHTVTIYRHAADAAPKVFSFCKYDEYGLEARFNMEGQNQLVRQTVTLWSADPIDGTALSLPSLGPLGALLSFASSAFTGATQVAQINIWLSRNCEPIPETDNTGTNANFPFLCGGIKQGTLSGGVTLRQSAIALTVPGINNAQAALSVAFGAASAGVSIATNLQHLRTEGNVDQGFGFENQVYDLVSSDGTNAAMVQWTDL